MEGERRIRKRVTFILSIFILAIFIDKPVMALTEYNYSIAYTIPVPKIYDPDRFEIAWDGESLWVIGSSIGDLWRVNKSGSLISFYQFPIYITGLEWINNSLYVMRQTDGQIYKLDPSSGNISNVFNLQSGPVSGIAWDGNNFWITNDSSNNVTELDSNFSPIFSFPSPSVYFAGDLGFPGGIYQTMPLGIAWKNGYFWLVAQVPDGNGYIFQIDSQGNVIGQLSSPLYNPRGITWIDSNLCLSAYQDDILCLNLSAPAPAVGGLVVPVDKFGLLAPYIALASTILIATAATAIYAKRRKKKQ